MGYLEASGKVAVVPSWGSHPVFPHQLWLLIWLPEALSAELAHPGARDGGFSHSHSE